MNAQSIVRIASYITAGLILIVGTIILTGFSLPDTVPTNFRIILGSMMVLYSIYRIVMVSKKKRNEES
jgi:hypothetical protein